MANSRQMKSEETHVFQSLGEFSEFFKKWAKVLGPKEVVLLDGPLGVGKTQLVRTVVDALGGKFVSSPSFAIHQRYGAKATPIDHVDLYRLKSEDDLDSTGFWDLFGQESGIVFVEWAGRLPDSIWPVNWSLTKVDLDFEGESGARRVVIQRTK